MKAKKNKGGQQGFLNASKGKRGATNKPGLANHPNFRSKLKANSRPVKGSKRRASNNPSYEKVARSIKKTKGY